MRGGRLCFGAARCAGCDLIPKQVSEERKGGSDGGSAPTLPHAAGAGLDFPRNDVKGYFQFVAKPPVGVAKDFDLSRARVGGRWQWVGPGRA